jgi:hypothetical protein
MELIDVLVTSLWSQDQRVMTASVWIPLELLILIVTRCRSYV